MFAAVLRFGRTGIVAAALVGVPAIASAATALAAVAANFADTAEALLPGFREITGHDLQLTTGSTGKLYAQIGEGAPFDLFLSADSRTPRRLLDEGRAVEGTGFTYAVGRLTLWSADPDRFEGVGQEALTAPGLRFVAIANPDLAPYGVAAKEVLSYLGLWEALQPKIVMGQNIGQTHSLVATGAAEIGFVALSAVLTLRSDEQGSRWDVPQSMYHPIQQDAVLLKAGADNVAARAFLDFLRTPEARAVLATHGYGSGT